MASRNLLLRLVVKSLRPLWVLDFEQSFIRFLLHNTDKGLGCHDELALEGTEVVL